MNFQRRYLYSCAIFFRLSLFSAAFSSLSRVSTRTHRMPRSRFQLWSKFEYSEEEISNMQAVITSMSFEETDESRRERLEAVLLTALKLPNHDAFIHLFDSQLIIIGDECKARAAKAAEAAASGQPQVEDGETPPKREKTPEEQQLWALVDMMIQSKTIVKRAKGELGSSGAFG